MNNAIRHTLRLERGMLLRINDGRGIRVSATDGQLWITQEGDARDHFLATGETLSIDRDGTTLIQAVRAATLALTAPHLRERLEPRATFSLLGIADVPV